MNQKELKEARQIAKDRARMLWEQTSDASPEVRPFMILEQAVRAYGRVAAHAYRRCESYKAQHIITVASSFYSHVLEDIAMAQSADLALRIWLCRVRFPNMMSYSFDRAHGVYIARTSPEFGRFSSLDLRILRHMREETRLLMALNDICDEMFKALVKKHQNHVVSCHPHAMMSFLAKYFFQVARISVGLDLSDASSPPTRFHSKYTLDLLYDVILFFVGGDDEDWPPMSFQSYVSLRPEANDARLDVTCSVIMTPRLWEGLLSHLETHSKAFQYLPEWGGRLEPLPWDYGYGQGASLHLPWVIP